METITDVFVGGFILVIGITMFFIFSNIHQDQVEFYLQQKVNSINNDEIYVSYLNAELDDSRTLADMISDAHINKDPGIIERIFGLLNNEERSLEDSLDSFLELVYSGKVCWTLYKDNEEWLGKNRCRDLDDMLNSSIVMPTPEGIINTHLLIEGYA